MMYKDLLINLECLEFSLGKFEKTFFLIFPALTLANFNNFCERCQIYSMYLKVHLFVNKSLINFIINSALILCVCTLVISYLLGSVVLGCYLRCCYVVTRHEERREPKSYQQSHTTFLFN